MPNAGKADFDISDARNYRQEAGMNSPYGKVSYRVLTNGGSGFAFCEDGTNRENLQMAVSGRSVECLGQSIERQRDAATEYAKAVEEKRKTLETRFQKTDADYLKKFETSINTGLEAAQKELAAAIAAGDAEAQVAANKRIATLAFENAKLEQSKSARETEVSKPADVKAPEQPKMQEPSDPRAEAWAAKNSWFGQDRAMTYTAFEIHKDLVDKEGFDPQSDEYYAEVDKRIRVDFPHKFAKTDVKQTTEPVQTVASAKRSVKPGRKTVKLTSSQVAIAKKLGVPLEEYAKQLKNTGGA